MNYHESEEELKKQIEQIEKLMEDDDDDEDHESDEEELMKQVEEIAKWMVDDDVVAQREAEEALEEGAGAMAKQNEEKKARDKERKKKEEIARINLKRAKQKLMKGDKFCQKFSAVIRHERIIWDQGHAEYCINKSREIAYKRVAQKINLLYQHANCKLEGKDVRNRYKSMRRHGHLYMVMVMVICISCTITL